MKSHGITFGELGGWADHKHKVNTHDLVCFVDADLPDVVERGQTLGQAIAEGYARPTTGLVIMFAGAALHAVSRTQPTVVASTAEAEATGLHQGAKYLMLFKNLLAEMKYTMQGRHSIIGDNRLNDADIPLVVDKARSIKAPILGDNKSSLLEFANIGRGSRLKHMRLKLAANQQAVERGDYVPYHVGTKQQLADILTKCATAGGYEQFRTTCQSLRGTKSWKLDLEPVRPKLV